MAFFFMFYYWQLKYGLGNQAKEFEKGHYGIMVKNFHAKFFIICSQM